MSQRVALVTGAAGGQGWAIAKRLRAAGYSVAACDRRADQLAAAVDELGDDDVIAVELDVTSPAQWNEAVERVVARFGQLSTLVNGAGVLHRAALADGSVGRVVAAERRSARVDSDSGRSRWLLSRGQAGQ